MADSIVVFDPTTDPTAETPISKTLFERVDVVTLQRLSTMTFDAFLNEINDSGKNKKKQDVLSHYKLIMKYVKDLMKSKGIARRTYDYTLMKDVSGNPISYEKGRLMGKDSIQGINGEIRGYLFGKTTTDIDVKNCHPVILKWLCKKHDIACPHLEYYINNRDDIFIGLTESFSAVGNEKVAKPMIIKLMYDFTKGKAPIIRNDWKGFLKNIRTELIMIRKTLSELDEYSAELSIAKIGNPDNIMGSFLSRVLMVYENDIMNHMVRYVVSKGVEVACYSYDGILVYGNYYNDPIFIKEIESYVNDKMMGVDIVLTTKPHKDKINDEWLETQQFNNATDQSENPQSYEAVKKDFECRVCKIQDQALFVIEDEKGLFKLTTKSKISDGYEHLCYEKLVYNSNTNSWEIRLDCFLKIWFKDPNIRVYKDIKCIPPPLICPPNIYNTWKPFAMEFIEDYEEVDIEPLLNHIKIISNHDEAVYTYIIEWIAHMIQFPAQKTTMLVIVGQEGNGKGTFMKMIEIMIGKNKYMESTQPERDVWGNFNGQMSQSYFVHLSELNKKQTADAMDIIKGLITDTALTINQKGKDSYPIDSYHRFCVATNHTEGGIKTYEGDRRKLVCKSSNEKIGDSPYWIELNKYINDINAMKSLYEYFKNYEGIDNFRSKPIPITEFQQDLYSLNESPILSYVKDLITETDEAEDMLEIPSKDFYSGFNVYLQSNKINYDVTEKLFSIRLKSLTANITTKHTRTGNKKVLDVVKLRKELNIGCMIEA